MKGTMIKGAVNCFCPINSFYKLYLAKCGHEPDSEEKDQFFITEKIKITLILLLLIADIP